MTRLRDASRCSRPDELPVPDQPGPVGVGRWLRRIAFAVPLLALVAAGAFALNAHWDLQDRQDLEESQEAASAAALSAVPDLLSYSEGTLDEDIARSQDLVSSDFRDDFTQLQDTLIKPAVGQRGFSTTAAVERIGLVDATSDQVRFLVFLSQSTTSPGATDGEPTATRALVTMKRTGSRWLIDGLEPV